MSPQPSPRLPPWPKLSETLTGPREPGKCQSCGNEGTRWWEECDESDRPTKVLVILCTPCEKKLIKPHPRLYCLTWTPCPWPGAMAICQNCTQRDGLRCTHPDLKANGGAGLLLQIPKGSPCHLNLGRGRGMFVTMYPYEPRVCAGYQGPLPLMEAKTV